MAEELKTLIDNAAKVCGGYSALAERIGMHQPDIPAMRAGRRAISPETVGLLADVLELDGEEARRLAAVAVISNAKNAGKAEVLRRAFFGCLEAGAALVAWIGLSEHATMYRLSSRPRRRLSHAACAR